MTIKRCPNCGSDRITKALRNWSGEFRGKTYLVEGLEFYECPVCGERVFDREAMRKIEAHSPAFLRSREIKKTDRLPKRHSLAR
jgi:YgiT-type zinc finger domain-containing protein